MTDIERQAREAAIDHGMWLAADDNETNYQAFIAGYYRGWSDKGAEIAKADLAAAKEAEQEIAEARTMAVDAIAMTADQANEIGRLQRRNADMELTQRKFGGFMGEKLDEIAELRAALDAGDAKGDAEVAELQEKCAELQAELHDWRESARKAAEESCGDEVHCSCVGPLRHQVVRQAQRIVEDAEEIASLEKIARLAVSLAEEFERAVASRNPVGGMSVPPSGDFIACAQLPSAVKRMRWWAREIRRAQTEWTEESEGE